MEGFREKDAAGACGDTEAGTEELGLEAVAQYLPRTGGTFPWASREWCSRNPSQSL